MLYAVLYFGSHPDNNNDDCWDGKDFETYEEAKKCYESDDLNETYKYCTEYIMLDGPNGHVIRKNPHHQPRNDDWRREIAMQAGMMGGCEAYNDAMGY